MIKYCIIFLLGMNLYAQEVNFANKAGDVILAEDLSNTFDVFKNKESKSKVKAHISQQLSFPVSSPNSGWEWGQLIFHTETKDSNNEYDPITGEFTANRDMRVKVNISIWGESGQGVSFIKAQIYKDGSWMDDVHGAVYHDASDRIGAELNTQISLKQGEKLRFYLYITTANQDLAISSAINTLNITEL